jgi:hypothetical protein
MDRNLWCPQISQKSDKAFPCPRCDTGKIYLVQESVKEIRPAYNVGITKDDNFEPDWIFNRFTGFFRCDDAQCGEIAIFSGHSEFVEIEDTEFGWGLEEAIHIDAFAPAPLMLAIPKKTPEGVRAHLVTSFSLYWLDFASCVARIRAGVEEILNERTIPSTMITTSGGHTRLTLNKRIDLFKANDPENAGYLDALRFLGNIGAHEANIDRDKVMDAYEIIETALQEIYAQRAVKLKALRDKIISTKGNY